MVTQVVNIRQEKHDVYIGRGEGGTIPDPPERGCFGNPFSVKKYGRKGAIERFVVYFYDRVEQDAAFREAVLALQGLKLGCFCKPEECHGDVIKQWLDEQLEGAGGTLAWSYLPPSKIYLAQGMDSCCFVYAVVNFLIWQGKQVSEEDIEKAKDIGLCRNGATIQHQQVVDFLNADLEKTEDEQAVFEKGGILNIRHPIWNGHSFFIHPTDRGVTAVNSWLGPLVAEGLGEDELRQFVSHQYGYFWVMK